MKYQIVTSIPREIFRTYDIRGIVDESFTIDNIYTLGKAIGSEALAQGINTLAVGRDGRISGPTLLKALIAGVISSGCDVISIDEVTTPILYYQAALLDSLSGIMLSGSHNPPNYNGIKMVFNGAALYGDTIMNFYHRIITGNLLDGTGSVKNTEIIDHYLKRIAGDIKLARPLKVVIDCGNGVGGKVAPELFRTLGCDVQELYCEVDGNFPNHQPDPADPKNLVDLIKTVEDQHADIGLAFDGDADRVGIITNKGKIITADRLLMFFAIDLLTRQSGATIIFDVKCGRNLGEQIARHGGIPMMYKTGHSLIKAKIRELGALLAGEMSGHIFMKERWFGFDDGIYAAARFLEILASQSKSCDEVFNELPESFGTEELKIPMAEEKKFKFMDEFIKVASFAPGKVNLIDGIRVDYSHGFGLVRPSNTSPYLIMRFEGDTQEDLETIENTFRRELSKVDPNINW